MTLMSRLTIAPATPSSAQLVAWHRLWRLLLARDEDEGQELSKGPSKESPISAGKAEMGLDSAPRPEAQVEMTYGKDDQSYPSL